MAMYTFNMHIRNGDKPSAHGFKSADNPLPVYWLRFDGESRVQTNVYLSAENREAALDYLDELSGCIAELRKMIENGTVQ